MSDISNGKSFSLLFSLIKSDFRRNLDLSAAQSSGGFSNIRMRMESILFKSAFHATVLFRISHWLYKNKWVFCARFFMRLNYILNSCDIGFSAEIGPGLLLGHPLGVIIGHNTRIGKHTSILSGVIFGVRGWEKHEINLVPEVGDNCVFSSRSTILGNCRIGNNCVIAINAVVQEDMPDDSFASGCPTEIYPMRGKEMISSWCL